MTDDDDNEPYPVATSAARLRKDMRALGSTEEEISRILSYLPHLTQKRKATKPNARRGKGRARQWIVDHADHEGDACLVFPFSRNAQNGYGQFGHNGENHYAHRYMCELVNGPPPTPEHEAGHKCGRGDEGCCHPKHLRWVTKSENMQDSIAHGTGKRFKPGSRYRPSLTPAQVNEIKELRGAMTQDRIADQFGISAPMVRAIFTGKTYKDSSGQVGS